ncbi:MAG: alpha/beta hydrolase family esterase [Panacagrimonas sp.]
MRISQLISAVVGPTSIFRDEGHMKNNWTLCGCALAIAAVYAGTAAAALLPLRPAASTPAATPPAIQQLLAPVLALLAPPATPAPPPPPTGAPPPLPPLELPSLGSQSGLEPPAGALVAEQITVGSVTRHYLLHTPTLPTGVGTSTKLPLVLVLHGNRQSAQQMADSASGQIWRLMADGIVRDANNKSFGPFYVAFLNGATASNLSTGPRATATWNDCAAARLNNLSTADDVGFARAVSQQLTTRFAASSAPNIESTRIYAYGFSNGAAMALRLGRQATDTVAAVAAIAGVDPQTANDECPVTGVRSPALIAHGTADQLVPYASNCANTDALPSLRATVCRLGHVETVNAWKKNSGNTIASDMPNRKPPMAFAKASNQRPASAPVDSAVITCVQHLRFIKLNGTTPMLDSNGNLIPGKDSDVRVEDCTITGGGHLEPSILTYAGAAVETVFGKQNNDAESVVQAWQFFRRHTKGN